MKIFVQTCKHDVRSKILLNEALLNSSLHTPIEFVDLSSKVFIDGEISKKDPLKLTAQERSYLHLQSTEKIIERFVDVFNYCDVAVLFPGSSAIVHYAAIEGKRFQKFSIPIILYDIHGYSQFPSAFVTKNNIKIKDDGICMKISNKKDLIKFLENI